MRWLRLVDSQKTQVSFAKEPYQKDYILQKRPISLRSLLITATTIGANAPSLQPGCEGCMCVCVGRGWVGHNREPVFTWLMWMWFLSCVTSVKESCHMYEWVNFTCVNDSRHIHEQAPTLEACGPVCRGGGREAFWNTCKNQVTANGRRLYSPCKQIRRKMMKKAQIR